MPLDWALDKVKSRRGEEEGGGRGSPENDVTGWWLLVVEDMTVEHGG